MGARRKAVLDYVRSRGTVGATRDEIAVALDYLTASTTSLVCGLIKSGMLVETGASRLTRAKVKAAVLVVVTP